MYMYIFIYIYLCIYIFFFSPTEKSGIEYHFILYLISAFSHKHTHTHAHTVTLFQQVENIQRTMRRIMWLNRLALWRSDWTVTGFSFIIIVGGYYPESHPPPRPQLTVFENKMARHHGTCHPLFFSLFFQVQRNKLNKNVDSQVWLT